MPSASCRRQYSQSSRARPRTCSRSAAGIRVRLTLRGGQAWLGLSPWRDSTRAPLPSNAPIPHALLAAVLPISLSESATPDGRWHRPMADRQPVPAGSCLGPGIRWLLGTLRSWADATAEGPRWKEFQDVGDTELVAPRIICSLAPS